MAPTQDFTPPTQDEIVQILKSHQLIRLGERVQRAFLVGSFAKELLGTGSTHSESDVDILLEVEPRSDEEPGQMEERYRKLLRQYFVAHDIRGKADHLHPQWCGRRVDVNFTYNASLEQREKVELATSTPKRRNTPRQRAS